MEKMAKMMIRLNFILISDRLLDSCYERIFNKIKLMKANERIIKNTEVEREKNYQKHLQRIDTIAAARRKSKSSSLDISQLLSKKSSPPRHGCSILEEKRIKMENDRLMKRLNEIGNRKKHFKSLTRDEEHYFTLNLKSREVYRKQKEQMIQE